MAIYNNKNAARIKKFIFTIRLFHVSTQDPKKTTGLPGDFFQLLRILSKSNYRGSWMLRHGISKKYDMQLMSLFILDDDNKYGHIFVPSQSDLSIAKCKVCD